MNSIKSFFIAGFECADHINKFGIRVNLQKITQHDKRVFQDYRRIKDLGISVAREGICWSEVEKKPFVFDFSRLKPFYDAAKYHDIQIIWDLCHFGYPDDLSPTHPQFSLRFEALAKQFCLFHMKNSKQPLWVVPINEISFLSWLSGEAKGTVPFTVKNGWEIKYHLCKAKINAIKIIKDILPNSTVLAVEPLIKIHASENNLNNQFIEEKNNYQYQALDILLGKTCPELGGNENLVDILGVNYYYNCQWNDKDKILPWPDFSKKRKPFSEMLSEVYQKYKLPMMLTETGHFGKLRSQWIKEISHQCNLAIKEGVDLNGICIYPIIDRPDWDNLSVYSQAGAWDLNCRMQRIPCSSYIETIKDLQFLFEKSTLSYLNPA